MHKNFIWQAFLLLVGVATVWYTVSAVTRYYVYSHLTRSTEASSLNWTIHEKNEDGYFIEGDYRFNVAEKQFEGRTSWPDQLYLNRLGAEHGVAEFSQRPWVVWYDPAYPERSTLDKSFPFKETLYAALLWLLFLYFIWLGFYVARYKT